RTRPLGIHHHRAKLVDGKYPPAIVGSATIALPAVRVRSSRLGVSRACTASASVTRAPVLPHPRLTVEYRTRAAQLDGECHHEHYGEQHHQSNTGQGNVQGTAQSFCTRTSASACAGNRNRHERLYRRRRILNTASNLALALEQLLSSQRLPRCSAQP